ncbi:hypothetical protein [Dyadobacter psychrotolerans]|uniref:DUF7847 domain-containing protein n=1 Tax=Dyadobacter psychrotolerans TaxID=2541721 RepID=A0A4R5DM45_9BACT|nr:hypothetical protein [Dyadobacter psychrotolerans]TDE11955.1 hypothetical protein E0F88_23150 [Dyadobacter psychrotolerans]
MKETPIVLLQQRDFGQKINASFDFAIKNFGPLLKVIFSIAGPSALLAGVAQGLFQSNLVRVGTQANPMGTLYQYLTIEYFFVGVFGVITYFLAYASVSAYMVLYEQKGPSEKPKTAEVWQKILENIPTNIGAQLLSFLLILIATLFFLIPGIYLAICFQFVVIISIREKLSVTDTLKRSYKLTIGKWWSTFGLILIMSIIASIIAIVFQFPLFVSMIMTTMGFGNGLTDSKILTVILTIISMVGSTIVQGLIWIAIAFQYYNLVERLDGSGLLADIESMGSGETERPADEGYF